MSYRTKFRMKCDECGLNLHKEGVTLYDADALGIMDFGCPDCGHPVDPDIVEEVAHA